jgi:CBS domain containing-hemolysin-like protein
VAEAVESGDDAVVVQKAIEHQDRFIAATQLGITLASLGLGWVGEPALGHLIDPLIETVLHALLGEVPEGATQAVSGAAIGSVIAFAIITFMHVVIGELMPKSIALQNPERTALWVAYPTAWATSLFGIPIRLLNGTVTCCACWAYITSGRHWSIRSKNQNLVRSSAESGLFEGGEDDIVKPSSEMRETRARQL